MTERTAGRQKEGKKKKEKTIRKIERTAVRKKHRKIEIPKASKKE